MKVFSTLAVLLLVGESSAIQHRHHHSHHHNKNAVAQKQRNYTPADDKLYPYPKAEGHEWHELDDHTERLHNQDSHQEDENSPYDPEVADAPEDIKRVDNDHEALHNAKLSADGYYTGYFAKDKDGNYEAGKHQAYDARGNLAQGHAVRRGVSDDSYDDHFDTLHNTISSTHHGAESYRKNQVDAEEKSNKWRGVKDKSIFDD